MFGTEKCDEIIRLIDDVLRETCPSGQPSADRESQQAEANYTPV
jgi:hypothetical protein